VPSCFSDVGFGTPPTLTRRRECPPPPLVPGEGAHSLAREGVQSPNSDEGTYYVYILYEYVLCALIALPPGGRSPYYLSTWEAWATGAMPWGNGTWAATPRGLRPPTGISNQINPFSSCIAHKYCMNIVIWPQKITQLRKNTQSVVYVLLVCLRTQTESE
jgi:hypothetical protein